VSTFIIPNTIIADYNRDQRVDIVCVQESYLHVFLQDPQGNFSNENTVKVDLNFVLTQAYAMTSRNNNKEQRDCFKDKIGMVSLKDLNQDGLLDMMVEKFSRKEGIFNPKKQFHIYFGQEAPGENSEIGVFNKTPDHIIVNRGFQIHSRVGDINHDGKMDIFVPVVEISIFKLIAMLLTGEIDVTIYAYLMDKDGKYQQKPDDELEFTIEIDKSGRKIPVSEMEGDFDADGRKDYLMARPGHLLLFFASDDGKLKKEADLEYPMEIPDDGRRVKAHRINSDERSDIVIVYVPDEIPEGRGNVRILITKQDGIAK